MDGDSKRQSNDLEKNVSEQFSNILSNDGNVLQSSRIRHIIQTSTGLDKFLLDYGLNVLPYLCFVSWIIFLITL